MAWLRRGGRLCGRVMRVECLVAVHGSSNWGDVDVGLAELCDHDGAVNGCMLAVRGIAALDMGANPAHPYGVQEIGPQQKKCHRYGGCRHEVLEPKQAAQVCQGAWLALVVLLEHVCLPEERGHQRVLEGALKVGALAPLIAAERDLDQVWERIVRFAGRRGSRILHKLRGLVTATII